MSSAARGAAEGRSTADFFSADHATARGRFLEASRNAGARLHELPLTAKGPSGEPLAIDIAWIGAADARHALLHTSGIHGVEAFAGSAIQLALLEDRYAPDTQTALVLVHVLNPYGMAWLRRANENNVDLNRNFLAEGEAWKGSPPLYGTIDPLLNPRSPPRRDAFLARAALRVLLHWQDGEAKMIREEFAPSSGFVEKNEFFFNAGALLHYKQERYPESGKSGDAVALMVSFDKSGNPLVSMKRVGGKPVGAASPAEIEQARRHLDELLAIVRKARS